MDRALLLQLVMRIHTRVVLVAAAVLATAGVATGERERSIDPDVEGGGLFATAARRQTVARRPVERAIGPPMAVAPGADEALDRAPTLVWHLGEALDGARVELSASPDFVEAATLRYDVVGERLEVPAVPGVWYWRLRGRRGSAIGDPASPSRSFVVRDARHETLATSDDPDWTNPYDLLLRGIHLGPVRDMRGL